MHAHKTHKDTDERISDDNSQRSGSRRKSCACLLYTSVYAHDYLKAYAIDCLLTAILFCFIGYFNGCGRTIFVMLQGIFGAFCVRIPVVYLMSRIEGATLFHIGLGTPVSSVVQIILCIIAYRYYANKRKYQV